MTLQICLECHTIKELPEDRSHDCANCAYTGRIVPMMSHERLEASIQQVRGWINGDPFLVNVGKVVIAKRKRAQEILREVGEVVE